MFTPTCAVRQHNAFPRFFPVFPKTTFALNRAVDAVAQFAKTKRINVLNNSGKLDRLSKIRKTTVRDLKTKKTPADADATKDDKSQKKIWLT